ncbi:MAG: phospho-N-acetylmuramoyl-pentapeptide-transferase, partial [Pirellulales bacterium]
MWFSASADPTLPAAACLPRALLAVLLAMALGLIAGPRLIRWLARRCPERIATDSATLNELHRHKAATPSMGGLLIILAATVAIGVFCSPTAPFTWLALLTLIGFGGIGLADDLRKLRRGRGWSPRTKLAFQAAVSTLIAVAAYQAHAQAGNAGTLQVPFFAVEWSIGLWYIPFATLVLVAASNSVNLTDGLDGLAGGCLLCSLFSLFAVAFALSSPFWSAWFDLPAAPHAAEMVVVAAAVIGALLAFLWFNCHPAQVFMGDCGSLPLGAVLGLIAIACRQELLLLVIGGVFAVETLSVILQVASFRTLGRRLFRCAPLHHHFQFAGWPETKIVVRFWIAAFICAGVGLFGVARQPLSQQARLPDASTQVAEFAP